jgi:hypothetical protein
VAEQYRITILGTIDQEWADWFGGLAIANLPEGKAVLDGLLPDKAALHSVLTVILNLNLTLLSVNRVTPLRDDDAGSDQVAT